VSKSEAQPLMYTELAEWFHLLTRPEDYVEEAAIYTRAIEASMPRAQTMLELGSGGGNNASHLKKRFEMTLVDLSPSMLAVSRQLNPELEHVAGDMRTVRLGRSFDVVFIHDAISYMTNEQDLGAALRTAYLHTRPGGMVLTMPDHTRETFEASTDLGGHDGELVTPPQPGRAMRYLQWMYDPDPGDTTYVIDFAYLLRESGQEVRCYRDRHVLGLFSRDTWPRLLAASGFEPAVLPFEHSEVPAGQFMFLGRRAR
jgi:ubiquinone/menaquinone biosynthesis C-methylase UbiE